MGHAMAETPAGVARALLYIVRASPTFFLHQSNQPFLSYLSSGYEPGSQGIIIEEAFHYFTTLLRSLTFCTAFKFAPAARRPRNDKMQRGLVTDTNNPSTSNQMLLDIT